MPDKEIATLQVEDECIVLNIRAKTYGCIVCGYVLAAFLILAAVAIIVMFIYSVST